MLPYFVLERSLFHLVT